MDQSQAQDPAAESEPGQQGATDQPSRSVLSYWLVCGCGCCYSPFQMVLYEGWHGADLDGVGVVGRVLKESVVGIKELLGQEEEELPGRPAVVQPEGGRKRRDRNSSSAPSRDPGWKSKGSYTTGNMHVFVFTYLKQCELCPQFTERIFVLHWRTNCSWVSIKVRWGQRRWKILKKQQCSLMLSKLLFLFDFFWMDTNFRMVFWKTDLN